MVRRVVQLHTSVLAVFSAILLIAPGPTLAGLGIDSPDFAVLSLSRVIAAVLAIAAVAVLPLPDLPAEPRRRALIGLAAAYFAATALLLVQETAIWNSGIGAVLVGFAGMLTLAFGAAATVEQRNRVARA